MIQCNVTATWLSRYSFIALRYCSGRKHIPSDTKEQLGTMRDAWYAVSIRWERCTGLRRGVLPMMISGIWRISYWDYPSQIIGILNDNMMSLNSLTHLWNPSRIVPSNSIREPYYIYLMQNETKLILMPLKEGRRALTRNHLHKESFRSFVS